MRSLTLTVCRVDISQKHKVPFNALKIFNDRSHVLHLPIRKRFQPILDRRYDERQEGLRMDFISNSMQKKKVVRSWARRRINRAVTEALKARGYDRYGRRLVDPNVSTIKGSQYNNRPIQSTVQSAPEALIGTVDIHVLPDSIKTTFTEVQRQAGVVVDEILKTCGRYPRHG